MIYKSADYINISTSANLVAEGAEDGGYDFSGFETVKLSGMGVAPGRAFHTTFASNDWQGIPVLELAPSIGEWTAVAHHDSPRGTEFLAFADPFGYAPLYFALTEKNSIVISDSFYGTVSGLRDAGTIPTLDLDNYTATVGTESTLFNNPSVHRTMASQVRILPLDKALLIGSSNASLVDRDNLSIAADLTDPNEAIDRGISLITDSLHTLFRVFQGHKTLLLSGGVDSRLLLALCINAGLSREIEIRTADPRNFSSPFSKRTILKDVGIANAIRQDYDLQWWHGLGATRFELDFAESLAAHQSYRSNFGYAFTPQPHLDIYDQPVLALRGGGGELLRTTHSSLGISEQVTERKTAGEIESGPPSEELTAWFRKHARRTSLFGDEAAEVIKNAFDSTEGNSLISLLHRYYMQTRNRTHFGHARLSATKNELSIHLLSNVYFQRATQLFSHDQRANGELVRLIFKKTCPSLLEYPFESEYWTAKLSAPTVKSTQHGQDTWESELNTLKSSSPKRVLNKQWKRNRRATSSAPISPASLESYVQRSFRLIESKTEGTTHKELKRFHADILKTMTTPSRRGLLVAKVASAVDIYYPAITRGSSYYLSASNQVRSAWLTRFPPIAPVFELPQDGWNNVPVTDFSVSLTPFPGLLIAEAKLHGAPSIGTEFAFYIYKDAKRVDIKWYSRSPFAIFELELLPGDYFATAFVRTEADTQPIYKSTSTIRISGNE